jgi:hypothetical protein
MQKSKKKILERNKKVLILIGFGDIMDWVGGQLYTILCLCAYRVWNEIGCFSNRRVRFCFQTEEENSVF